mmetsp:Transcript_22857/g.53143  ORF Transcript_22857/g.53143 Transcript_22857/m.53143 type:complete len:243 (+) Transcript_22857:415-1143(+)
MVMTSAPLESCDLPSLLVHRQPELVGVVPAIPLTGCHLLGALPCVFDIDNIGGDLIVGNVPLVLPTFRDGTAILAYNLVTLHLHVTLTPPDTAPRLHESEETCDTPDDTTSNHASIRPSNVFRTAQLAGGICFVEGSVQGDALQARPPCAVGGQTPHWATRRAHLVGVGLCCSCPQVRLVALRSVDARFDVIVPVLALQGAVIEPRFPCVGPKVANAGALCGVKAAGRGEGGEVPRHATGGG